MANFLNQALSQFVGVSTPISYVYPTVGNIDAGVYTSEIMSVDEILNDDGSLNALDFYHRLTDCNGKDLYVRFRYYKKELASLAESLSKYPEVETWSDTVGLKEKIVVSKKSTGSYMGISSRSAIEEDEPSSRPLSTKSSATKRSGPLSRPSRHVNHNSSAISKQVLVEDDEEDEDDYLDDED